MPLRQPIRQDNDVCQLSKWPLQLNGGLGRSEIGKRIDLRTFLLFPWERQLPGPGSWPMGFVPGAISVSNGRRTSRSSGRLEQQFEMVARPRNHFCYNSLTVPI